MNKYMLLLTADIYTDIDSTSNLFDKFGNQFADEFYILLYKYAGNNYLFRNNKIELRLTDWVSNDE